MKTFNELKEGDLLLVEYYREEEFAGNRHNKICRAKNVVLKDIKKQRYGTKKRITFELDDDRLNIYGKQTHEFVVGGLNKCNNVTFNAPGAIEICCDPIYGIRNKKKLLMGEISELDLLIHKIINKLE